MTGDGQEEVETPNENEQQEPKDDVQQEKDDDNENKQQELKEGGQEEKDDDNEEEEDDEDEDEEDDIKVTIEDYTADQQTDKQTIQKQPHQAKQAAPAILEANQHIVDINNLEDKPWRKPGADINDYFNYGFDETSWKQYCDHQKQMKNISNDIAEVRNETYRIPVVGHNDMVHKHNNHYNQIPVVPSVIQPVVMHPSRDQHMRDLSPMMEHQSHSRSRRHERQQQHQISPPLHQPPSSGVGGRSGRYHRPEREVSSHRHSRSPHSKERERKHSSGRARKESKSRDRRRSRSKEVSSKKRRSRSREREDDRRSKRHKSSRRA